MSFSVQLAEGSGVLARFAGAIVLAPADSPLLDQVLELARVTPAAALPRRVAGLIASSDEAPTLALVCTREDGLAVLLVGDASMTVHDAGGTAQATGRDAITWVDRIVRAPWTELQVELVDAGGIDPRSDLQAGVVRASGARLRPSPDAASSTSAAPMPSAAPAPAPPSEPPPSSVPGSTQAIPPVPVATEPAILDDVPIAFESFSLAEPVLSDPLPVAGRTPEDGVVMVQGIECSRQHFNDPTAIYCSVCGISMVHQTHNLVSGPRPPLGVLVMDDGAVFTLDGDYVLGREPENAEEVLAGTARPLALEDPDVTMSRIHAKLLLDRWDVQLVDAGSANGSYVAAPGESDWTRLPAGESQTLKPGARVSIGGRTMVFDSHHKL